VERGKKKITGWVLYDWANSAFATTIIAGFFPVFFKSYWCGAVDATTSTARLGYGSSIAALVVALGAPILGAIADRGGARKRMLVAFGYMGVLMTACLFFVPQGQWAAALVIYALASLGFAAANVFYDSLLPDVAPRERLDFISGLGFSLGYLGGGLLLLLNTVMTLRPGWFGLADSAEAVRYAFLTVAAWWGGFTVLTVLWVPETKSPVAISARRAVRDGFRQLADTFRHARRSRNLLLFLLAYWFYIDGVGTIIRMAIAYGMSLGFRITDLIVALLVVQFVGFPASLIFGKLGNKWGAKRGVLLGIGVYMAITLWGVFITRREEFYILAVGIGLVQGGVQALSRSLYARLIPREQSAEFFGFYNMVGKLAAIMGPALMAAVGLTARALLMPAAPSPEQLAHVTSLSTRISLASVLVLFAAGGCLLWFVNAAGEVRGGHGDRE
jgi:UMF1 family MFS transporter